MTTCAVSEAADETGAAGAAACWKARSAKSTCIGALKIAEGERVALPCTTAMTEAESHRILVVDDEPDITAANGREAARESVERVPELAPGTSVDRVVAWLTGRHTRGNVA